MREWIPSPDPTVGKNAFIVVVDGDSMDLVVKSGAHAVVDPDDRRLTSGKMYVIRNGGGETTFKLFKDGPARLEPLSSNKDHTTLYPGEDGFEVIGRVTMTMKVDRH